MQNNFIADAMDLIDISTRKIEDKLHQGDINAALAMMRELVSDVIDNSFYVDKILSSSKLDQLCLRIGYENLAKLNTSIDTQKKHAAELPKIIYIVSCLKKSGGHTRVVLEFIRAQPKKEHLILITGVGGVSDKSFLNHELAGSKNVVVKYAPKKNLESRLSWLQNILLDAPFEHVYLFNNHEDSVAVSALTPNLVLSGSFYHHADHHLCLGVHLNHIRHIDPHPMGYHRCRKELNIDNSYLPFSIDDKGFVDAGLEDEYMFTSATAARHNKIEVPYHISYLEVIPQVLRVTGGKHLHIGKLTPWALYSIRRQIKKLGIPSNRFIYIDHVPSVWKTLQEYGVNLYIASFPYGGGLTLIEAMGAGIPVILHKHSYSRVLSGLELAYPEAFSWSEPEELYRHLKNLSIRGLKLEGLTARIWYVKNYRRDKLVEYLKKSEGEKFPVSPLSARYTSNSEKFDRGALHKHTLTQIAKFFLGKIRKTLNHIFGLIGKIR